MKIIDLLRTHGPAVIQGVRTRLLARGLPDVKSLATEFLVFGKTRLGGYEKQLYEGDDEDVAVEYFVRNESK